MLNFKQIIVSFILCSIVALANNVGHTKQVNANKANNLKECKNEQDRIQSCVEKNMMKKRWCGRWYCKKHIMKMVIFGVKPI